MSTDALNASVRFARRIDAVPPATQETAADEISAWLTKQPAWLHSAADRLCEGEGISESLVFDSVDALLATAAGAAPRPYTVALSHYDLCGNEGALRLTSIEGVQGVNMIVPGSSLVFGDSRLTIVFGNNGAGKSGFVRLLKVASGRCGRDSVLPNVFDASRVRPSWSVIAECGGEPTTFDFGGTDRHDALTSLQVFDEELADDYRVNDRELTFEPPVLRLFDDLIRLVDAMARELEARKGLLPSKIPAAPADLQADASAAVLGRIKAFKSEAEARAACAFGAEDERALAEVVRKAGLSKSAEAIEKLRRRTAACQSLQESLSRLAAFCKAKSHETVSGLRGAAEKAETALKAASGLASGASVLGGLGTAEWRAMWEAARAYSEAAAYPGSAFPALEPGTLCVLCQQDLSEEARSRMGSFDAFVLGAASAAHKAASAALASALAKIPADADAEALFQSLAQMEGFTLEESVAESALGSVKSCLAALREGGSFVPALLDAVETEMARVGTSLAADYQLATSKEEVSTRNAVQADLRRLGAKKWLSEQADAVVSEWERLRQIRVLDEARRACNTSEVTMQKTRLADRLVTGKVAQRFGEELRALRAGKLPVSFEKKRGQKGKVLHGTSVAGSEARVKPNDVLSEGERRVLALAAFLADTMTADNGAPFVFDDPISSLDHVFERAVAKRLAILAKDRQVIVFTHRISFAMQLEAAGETQEIAVEKIGLRSDASGAGIQGDFPFDKDPKSLASKVINDCPRLRKEAAGKSESERRDILIGTFSTMRRAVERSVETVLLVDVVKRYDPAIHAANIVKLALISEADCSLLDRLMSEYSREIHDQADELDNAPLDVDELEADAKALKGWIEEFRKRTAK